MNHPLLYQHRQMGALFNWEEDLKNWSQDLVNDLNKDYIDPALDWVGLTKEQQDAIKKEAEASIQSEIQKQQQELAQSILQQASPSVSAPQESTVTQMISDIESSEVVKAIPGGIYTLGGVSLVILFLLLRGR